MCFVLSHEKCLLAHCTRYPPVCGAKPKRRRRLEEASTHMTLTDIKRPQAIAIFSKYLVYQVLSGVSVSRDTLCLMTPLSLSFNPKGRGSISTLDIGARQEHDGSSWTPRLILSTPYTPSETRSTAASAAEPMLSSS